MTPNRHNGRDSTRWWAELPPRIRERCTPVIEDDTDDVALPPKPPVPSKRRRYSGRLALVAFLAITNILVILLTFLFLVTSTPKTVSPS